jgi:hypothetical protein
MTVARIPASPPPPPPDAVAGRRSVPSPFQQAPLGRGLELERIQGVIERRDVLPVGILLHGRAGIGKTVLWSEAARLAQESGFRVLGCALAQGESSLAFAGLADLLHPVLAEVLPSLPGPRARALETALALGSSEQGAPDERAVAFGFHSAVAMLASAGPVALAIDDIQWLDPSSTLMLSYAIRRLRREPVLLLLGRRDGTPGDRSAGLIDDTGVALERIFVGPLPLGAVHRLIRLRLGASLTRPQLLRVHAASEGNPLHALELARAMQGSEPHESGSLATLLADRVAALPELTRQALLLGALSTERELGALSRAHSDGQLLADLQPAIDADLVVVAEGRLLFTHPLVESAVEAGATSEARRTQRSVRMRGWPRPSTRPPARRVRAARGRRAPGCSRRPRA